MAFSMSRLKKPIIFCCRPSIYASILLRRLLANDAVTVNAIVISTRFRRINSNLFYDSISVIRHSGWRYFFYLATITELHALVGGFFGLPSVKQLAKRYSVPVCATDDVNSLKGLNFIRSSMLPGQANLLLSAMFNQKISAKILQLPHLTSVNFHPGLLPKFRGVDPVLASLQHKELHCHVFLHQTSNAFDEGEVIASQRINTDNHRSVFWHQYRLFDVGANMVSEWLKTVWAKDLPINVHPQLGEASYYTWPSKADVKSIGRLFDGRDLRTLLFDRQ